MSFWLLLTLVSVFLVSIAGILQRVLMRDVKSDPYSYAVIFNFLIAILNLLAAFILGSKFPQPSWNLIYILIPALLWGGASIFLFKSFQTLEASEVTIISTLRVVITILASILFLQETFNFQKVIGTLIIIVATLFVTNVKKGLKFNKGIIYTLAMALFSGLALVADAFNIRHFDPVAYNTIANFLVGFLLLAYYPKTLNQWRIFVQPNFLKKMLPLGIFSTIQALLYLFAFANGGHASQVGTIRQTQVIVTVLLAVIFLNERDMLIGKLTAAILVTIGVFLLS